METNEEPWSLVIGQVTAPFGTKGELRVRPETDFPERFQELEEVCLASPGGRERVFRVRSARATSKGIILALAECRDRGEAELLRRAWIKIRPSMAVPLPEGKYWVDQIIGLRVFTVDGTKLGEVTDVLRTPANDVYVTPSAMIPAVRQIVRQIDLENGRIVVSLPPDHEGKAQGGEP